MWGRYTRSLWNSAVPGEERIPITFLSSQRWLLFVQGLSQKQAWSEEGLLWIDCDLLSFLTGNGPLVDVAS